MKFLGAFVALTALTHSAAGAAVPATDDVTVYSRSQEKQYQQHAGRSTFDSFADLWKRKGGGGSGGRGGGSSSSGSGSSSSSSGGRSGSSGGSSSSSSGSSGSSSSSSSSGSRGGSSSSSSSSSSSGRGSSTSNVGGATKTGSGPKPAYGAGGTSYGGGAKSPYAAGSKSPSGIVPGLLIGSALGFWGTYWLIGAYHYPYAHPYSYYNASSKANETKPVECLCRTDQECGCDDNSADSEYMTSIIGNGSYDGLNKTLVNVANDTIYINGTLPNGTTASGGTDDVNGSDSMQSLLRSMGWWPIATTALALAYLA